MNYMKVQQQSKGHCSYPTAIFMVERTVNGQLLYRLRQREAELRTQIGRKIKFIEKTGTPLGDLLVRKNPWSGRDCKRVSCLTCVPGSNKNPNCRRRNIVYANQCQSCKEDGKNVLYIGESCRSLHERLQEHYQDVGDPAAESHMRVHCEEVHGGELNFKARIIQTHHSAFTRQVSESIQIKLLPQGGGEEYPIEL